MKQIKNLKDLKGQYILNAVGMSSGIGLVFEDAFAIITYYWNYEDVEIRLQQHPASADDLYTLKIINFEEYKNFIEKENKKAEKTLLENQRRQYEELKKKFESQDN